MRSRTFLPAMVVLAAGALLGWLTASGRLVTLSRAQGKLAAKAAVGQPAHSQPDRTILPIQEPQYPPITEIDARKAKAPPRFEVKAPEGAPNVVIVLIRRYGLRPVQRLRRADPHAHLRAAGRQRTEVQPLSHLRSLFADSRGTAHRPQSPHLQHRLVKSIEDMGQMDKTLFFYIASAKGGLNGNVGLRGA